MRYGIKESLITVVPIGGVLALFPVGALYNHIGFRYLCPLDPEPPSRRCLTVCAIISIIPSVFIPILTAGKTFSLAIFMRIIQGSLFSRSPSSSPSRLRPSFSRPVHLQTVCLPALLAHLHPVHRLRLHPDCRRLRLPPHRSPLLVTAPLPDPTLSRSSLGWHSAHYMPAGLTFVILLVFVCVNFDDEFKEKVSQYGVMDVSGHLSLNSLIQALCAYQRTRSAVLNFRLPYLSIYQDATIWAYFIAAFGYFTAIHLYLQYGPTFLHKVYPYSPQENVSGGRNRHPPYRHHLHNPSSG